MERPNLDKINRFNLDSIIGWGDILKGVGEIIVDEAKLAFHAIFDHIRHEGISDHAHPTDKTPQS